MSAISAPRIDLQFIQAAITYKNVDKDISQCIIHKMSNHLLYLADEPVALAFFDKSVTVEEKREMVKSLQNESDGTKRLMIKPKDVTETFKQKRLSDFVSKNTKQFFKRFGIDDTFLKQDPNKWAEMKEYQQGLEFCSKLSVVNDVAERNVKLMSDFNNVLTNDEEDKQFLLQVVTEYRRQYPSSDKSKLNK